MALSGSYDFNLARSEIIRMALEKVGVLEPNGAPTSEQDTSAARELDSMVKSWEGEGINLWSVDWTTQTLSASTIIAGTDGNDYECVRNHTSANSNKPIAGADYTSYWKATGGTGAGAVWASATAYTSICNYSLNQNIIGIKEAFLRRDNYDTPLNIISESDYMGFGNKSTAGQPTSIWFRRLHTPEIFLYSYPDTVTDVVHMAVIRKSQDMDTASNEADFLSGWLDALTYGLAARLADTYSLPLAERQQFFTKAEIFKNTARMGSQETGDLHISPDLRGYK